MNYPTLSIITLSYNADPGIWERVLRSIDYQKYPKQNIEHLVMDGGSTNDTLVRAKKHTGKIYFLPKLKDNPEGRKGFGIAKARNKIIVFLETDNILPNDHWFSDMILPFVQERNIVAAYSMHNTYTKEMPPLTKYCALIGVNDPTVYYLGKSEKVPVFQKTYNKGILIKDTKEYSVIRFLLDSLPVLGDNGHMVTRTLINRVNTHPASFRHTDAFFTLAREGFNTYGVVKNSIIHFSGSNIFSLYKRRTGFKKQYQSTNDWKRYYYVFDKNKSSDWIRLIAFIFCSLTVIQPLAESIRGYLSVRERSWFLHPVVCLVAVYSYVKNEIEGIFNKK